MKLKMAYDNFDFASEISGLLCLDKSLAVQDAAEEVDINTIVRRFNLTGQLPQDVRPPEYGDFTEVGDYHSAMNAVLMAEASFMAMPAHVRAEFNNSPQLFLEYCSDERNRDGMKALGLLVPDKVAPEPVAVRVIADVPPDVGSQGTASGG